MSVLGIAWLWKTPSTACLDSGPSVPGTENFMHGRHHFSVFFSIKIQSAAGFGFGLWKAAFRSEQARQGPMRFIPDGRCGDAGAQAVLYGRSIVGGRFENSQVVPGVLQLLRGFGGEACCSGGDLTEVELRHRIGSARRRCRPPPGEVEIRGSVGAAPVQRLSIGLSRAARIVRVQPSLNRRE